MALGDDFITLSELRHYMTIKPTDHDTELTDAIGSATAEIIRYCHRDFNDAGSATARTYVAGDSGILVTDDFHTSVGLIVASGGTTYDNANLKLIPRNGIMQGMTGWPYWKIEGDFVRGAEITVTARWGWAAVPKPVRQAAFILSADTFQLKDQRLGVAGSDAFGSVITIKDSRPAKMRLKPYRRDSVLVDG